MIYTPLTKKALKICFDAHKEQTDKAGLPYVFHPFHLAEQMPDEACTVAALLHDVVEDTFLMFEALEQEGFGKEVMNALKLLTHDPLVPYMDYIRHLSTNSIARTVKLADLRHNSDLSRLEIPTSDDLQRHKTYLEAIRFLEAIHSSPKGVSK